MSSSFALIFLLLQSFPALALGDFSSNLAFTEGRAARCFVAVNKGEPNSVEVPEGARFSYAFNDKLQLVARGPTDIVLADLQRLSLSGLLVEFRVLWNGAPFYESRIGRLAAKDEGGTVLLEDQQAYSFGRVLPVSLGYKIGEDTLIEALCQ
jgi:hypothetical protein